MHDRPKGKILERIDALFLISIAFMVVLPDGSALPLLVFGLWGIFKAFHGKEAGFTNLVTFWLAEARRCVLAVVLVIFVLGNSFLLALHAASSSEYEQLIPFILFPFATWLFVLRPVSLRIFSLGVAIAAISSGLFALVQVLWFEMPHESRASGWMANPIHFGHLCVLLAVYCLVGLLSQSDRTSSRSILILYLGFILSLLGAVLSGSKSSWIAFAATALYLGVVVLRTQGLGWKMLVKSILGVFLLFTFFVFVSPSSKRLQIFQNSISNLTAAVLEADKPLNIEALGLDPSVNDRIVQYQMSAQLIVRHPWIGISRPDISLEQKMRVANGEPGFKRVYRHIHSEYLDTLVNRGVLGFVLLTSMFFVLLFAVRETVKRKSFDSNVLFPSQTNLLRTSTLLLFAFMAMFDILLSRISVMAPGLFVIAYCLGMGTTSCQHRD